MTKAMRAVIQRVTDASVAVEGKAVGRIQVGLMVLLGVAKGDDESDARYVVEKIRNLRIFADEQGKMNRSLTYIKWRGIVGLPIHSVGPDYQWTSPQF